MSLVEKEEPYIDSWCALWFSSDKEEMPKYSFKLHTNLTFRIRKVILEKHMGSWYAKRIVLHVILSFV